MPTVLVVEDDREMGLFLQLALDRAGYDTWLECDGEAGMLAAARLRPDVVLLDWMLPYRSGVEVCRALRAVPGMQGTAVIVISSRDQEYDREWAFAAGVDDYLTKPFTATDLLGRVARLLGGD